jgi:hypothetical protein
MAKKSTKSAAKGKTGFTFKSFGSGLAMLALALFIGAIGYKQLVLGSLIRNQLPYSGLAAGLENCARAYYNPLPLNNQSGFNMDGLLSTVWSGASAEILNVRAENVVTDEIKILKVDDFFGKFAQLRVSGAMTLRATVPVWGDRVENRLFQLVLAKQDSSYAYTQLEIKGQNEMNWQAWPCSGNF